MYTVQDLVKISGLSAHTIRYYCKIGLLGDTKRDNRNFRLFDDADVKRLMTIQFMKKLHLSLEEIKEYVDILVSEDVIIERRNAMVKKHEAEIEQQIEDLQFALAYIRHKPEYFAISREVILEDKDYRNKDYTAEKMKEINDEIDRRFREYLKKLDD